MPLKCSRCRKEVSSLILSSPHLPEGVHNVCDDCNAKLSGDNHRYFNIQVGKSKWPAEDVAKVYQENGKSFTPQQIQEMRDGGKDI